MSTITAILEADVDGTLHLPLPAELRHGKVRIIATLELVSMDAKPVSMDQGTTPKPGSLTGFWMAPDFDEPLKDFNQSME